MPAYECPKCGGGFPESPDSECPWCGLAVDGSYLDDLPGRPASDLFDSTRAPASEPVDPLDLPDEFVRGGDLSPNPRTPRGRADDRTGGDDA
jgi:hypothetical protein